MSLELRIGTRDSKLALWQANAVVKELNLHGIAGKLVHIKSKGDLDQTSPIEKIGSVGVFTKALDDALLNDEIDAAVHSLKDVPTLPSEKLRQACVLKRTTHSDVLISTKQPGFIDDETMNATIATGSMRRRAQWLNRYPHHQITGLRGNVDTRLKKLEQGDMDAIILSAAGIIRLGLKPRNMIYLNWMIPAPAQGVVGIFCRHDDLRARGLLTRINDPATEITSFVERQLLRTLEGGCSAPIGAHARIVGTSISLIACLLNFSGTKIITVEKTVTMNKFSDLGEKVAKEILKKGGSAIMKEIRNSE